MKNQLMKKVVGGLAGIALATSISLNADAQRREYMKGNVNGVEYRLTTEKDFPKYKLEKQCLFDNCYTFWEYTPKADELDFAISEENTEVSIFKVGDDTRKIFRKYIPKKVADKIDITDLNITKTSYEKLKKRAKSKEYFGFSVDITDKDLKFNIPEIEKDGVQYIVLKTISDETGNQDSILPFYLIPKVRGTEILIPDKEFVKEGYRIQATIFCNENGGVYLPFSEKAEFSGSNKNAYPSGVLENKVEQDTIKKTDYMKEREEQEKRFMQETQTQDTLKTPVNAKEEKPCTKTYIIQPGDTYFNIADRFLDSGKDASGIQKLNPTVNPNKLQIGQKILIPCE